MIKINIKKNNLITHGATFENTDLSNAWIEEGRANKFWGKPSGFYPISQLTEEELFQEISRKTTDEEGNPLFETMVEIPDQFSIEIIDITDEVNEQNKIAQALQAQDKGKNIICKVWALNESKNISIEQTMALFNDPTLLAIERCLRNGALQSAQMMIQQLDTQFYTIEEKNKILEMF
jgi:hypothetical protein